MSSHYLNSKNKCYEEFIAVKTDILKAFDRVEWSFMDFALKSIGFPDQWKVCLMSCVKSVTYQVLINGSPQGHIQPTRGIRQGDPLSPYLFVMCTEMLVKMMQQEGRDGRITGLKIAKNFPSVSHLLFADDSMFYCKENDKDLAHISTILERYTLTSSQRINY